MVRQERSSWNFNSTYLKTIKASENWDFYVVLNCKEVGQGLCWTMEQTLSKEHQNTLKSLKTINLSSLGKKKSDLSCLPWHV